MTFCRLLMAGVALGSIACSPTFNWREAKIADAGLVALLPCKPKRAERMLPLDGRGVPVDLTGCEAGGATFAIAHASATDAEQAALWIEAWKSAARARAPGGAHLAEQAAQVPRALDRPPAARTEYAEAADSGPPSVVQMLWFAQRAGAQVAVYQATVVGLGAKNEAARTFFEGLHLP